MINGTGKQAIKNPVPAVTISFVDLQSSPLRPVATLRGPVENPTRG